MCVFVFEYNVETLIIFTIYRALHALQKRGEGELDVVMIWDTVHGIYRQIPLSYVTVQFVELRELCTTVVSVR
jgi:hypothetical protein